MATLKLVWIKCDGLAAGQSIRVTPVFLDVPVNSPSGPVSLTLTDSNPVLFQPETKVDFYRMNDFIYLRTPDGAVFSSKAIIWDRKTVAQETQFELMLDPTGAYSNLQPTVYYDLKESVPASSER